MKTTSLILTIVIAVFMLATGSCRKKDRYMSDAIITGNDFRKCMCCGGMMITFSQDPQPYGADFKIISNSADLNLSDNPVFPIYVKVDWTDDSEGACNGMRIKVTKMKVE